MLIRPGSRGNQKKSYKAVEMANIAKLNVLLCRRCLIPGEAIADRFEYRMSSKLFRLNLAAKSSNPQDEFQGDVKFLYFSL
jgi:hypothetical protein